MIPLIDATPLFAGPSPARDAADAAILRAAGESGFMTLAGSAERLPIDAATRARLLRLFDLPAAPQRRLWRQKFAPENPNRYRGWFPVTDGMPSYKEGIDIGPNLVRPPPPDAGDDPLLEATPLPDDAALPGWRDDAARYYRAMEALGQALMRAIARGLGLPETQFDAAFAGGISTLRLIRYPLRPPQSLAGLAEDQAWVTHDGQRRMVIGAAHVDSGFVTLLAQDGVPGLQAETADGVWVDVPPTEGRLAVNFGGLLERWTGGRIRATRHRILAPGVARCSIPFFYEPRVDAAIAPLPLTGAPGFAPFTYGDHLWAATTRFTEFRGMEALRPPRGLPAAA